MVRCIVFIDKGAHCSSLEPLLFRLVDHSSSDIAHRWDKLLDGALSFHQAAEILISSTGASEHIYEATLTFWGLVNEY